MAAKSGGAVVAALLGNGFLTLIKTIAFVVSRSPAMLSEAIHSFADTANQLLLFIGIKRSNRPADERFHWGYGSERYLFALLSAMGIFVLGCGVTVYHGVYSMLNPPDLTLSWITFVVLGISLVVDGVVFMSALREVYALKGDQSLFKFLRESPDPTLLAVLFEDFVATLGVIIAFLGILLAHLTDTPELDAAASIIIGLMLGVIAIWLGYRNGILIIGPAIPKEVEKGVRAYLEAQESIENIRGVRTRIVGSNHFAFAADVDYNGAYLGRKHAEWVAERVESFAGPESATAFSSEFGERMFDALAAEIDRIERELLAKFPILSYVDLESDDAEKPYSNRPKKAQPSTD